MRAIETWMLSCLINSAWQIPVLFLAGLPVARGLRRLGATAEHRSWTTVLVLSAVLPMASTLPFNSLLRGFRWAGAAGPADPHVTVLTGGSAALAGRGVWTVLPVLLAWVYLALCVWFGARFVWRCIRLQSMARKAETVTLSGDAADIWARCSLRFGVGSVEAAVSPHVFGPITFGLARQRVILPANLLSEAEGSDLEALIAHEFAHIRRRDFMRNLLCEFVVLPVSYHPLLWAIRERVAEGREMVCDEMAANLSSRERYARSLLRLARLLLQGQPVTTPHAIGIFDANSFERRLMRLTETHHPTRGLRRIAIVATCGIFGFGIGSAALALHVRVNAPEAQSNAQHAGPVAVSPKIMAGQRINGRVPVYPPEAKKDRVQGIVLLGVVVSEHGTVENVHLISDSKEARRSVDEVDHWTGHKYAITTNAALQQSAIDAVRQWTYKPFLLNGQPVAVATTVHVIFSLGK